MADSNINNIEQSIEKSVDTVVQVVDKYDSVLFVYLIHFAVAIGIIIIGQLISRIVSRHLNRVMIRRQVETTLVNFTVSIVRYSILVFAVIAALGQLGVQTASIVAVVGAAGLAIGLALQGSLSNFAAGVLLVIFRPFKVGETVDLGILGTVQEVHIFSTTLLTSDGKVAIIPNSKVVSGNIINYTRDPNRRIELVIGVDYNTDLQHAKKALTMAIDITENISKERNSSIIIDELASSSINFKVMVWVKNPDYAKVRSDLLENIKMQLDNHGINIPYPTMELNLNHSPVPTTVEEKAKEDSENLIM